jgi:hypothetical protein
VLAFAVFKNKNFWFLSCLKRRIKNKCTYFIKRERGREEHEVILGSKQEERSA